MTPTARNSASAATWNFVQLAFVLSGACALAYEVLWGRWLASILGSSATAACVVLASYMGGQAAGARLFGSWSLRLARPLYAYVAVEIGSSALIFPFVADLALGLAPATRVGLAVAILVIPTVLLGGTVPLVLGWSERVGLPAGATLGRLYGLNTVGAALGAMVTGFVLIPRLGLSTTNQLAAAANFAIALMILPLALRQPATIPIGAPPSAPAAARSAVPAFPLYVAAFLSGCFAIYLRLAGGRVGRRLRRAGLAVSALLALAVFGLPGWSPVYLGISGGHLSSAPDRYEASTRYFAEGRNSNVWVATSDHGLSMFVDGKPVASTSAADRASQLLLGHLPALLAGDPKAGLVVGMGTAMTLGSLSEYELDRSAPARVQRAARDARLDARREPRDAARMAKAVAAGDGGRAHARDCPGPASTDRAHPRAGSAADTPLPAGERPLSGADSGLSAAARDANAPEGPVPRGPSKRQSAGAAPRSGDRRRRSLEAGRRTPATRVRARARGSGSRGRAPRRRSRSRAFGSPLARLRSPQPRAS
jgi:hypothetical protein